MTMLHVNCERYADTGIVLSKIYVERNGFHLLRASRTKMRSCVAQLKSGHSFRKCGAFVSCKNNFVDIVKSCEK